MIMMNKKRSALISGILGPREEIEPEGAEGGDEAIHAIAEELIEAVHNKDKSSVASCLKAAFEELDDDGELEQE